MKNPTNSLSLVLYPEQLPAFFPFLQQGVTLRVLVGGSVTDLLARQFGIAADYLHSRITTLFLNGKAIDNADSALIRDGSVLALSGAMPGLVGATMRSGGYYAAMRSSISHQESGAWERTREGAIRLKLFNLLLAELGPVFLREGIILENSALAAFLTGQEEEFWRDCRKALLNGKPVDWKTLQAGRWLPPEGESTLLTVNFRERI